MLLFKKRDLRLSLEQDDEYGKAREDLSCDIFLYKLQSNQVRLVGLAIMNRNEKQEADLSIFALFNLINVLFI